MEETVSTKEHQQFEKIPTQIFPTAFNASDHVARDIADLIRERAKTGKNVVLGLATGSTPTKVYDQLVKYHRDGGLSFANVVTFNLDEYYPIQPDSLQSYVRFMNENLFDHIDIKPENVNIPDGTVDRSDVYEYCRQYEQKIIDAGGIDIQLLGIGRTGHIGFNEPGSTKDSKTRLITLDKITRLDAASDFFGEENVPRRAITMGVGSILSSAKIYLMAWGDGKAPVIAKTVEGHITDIVPATFLQNHRNAHIILDEAAGSELIRNKTPWLVGPCKWTDQLTRAAVVWLCQQIKKPILKLTDEDYNEHGLGELVTEYGPAYNINIKVFNSLQHTITGWPGGKPNADDSSRPERAEPFPKRVLIFSPHPDDDVISMGATLIRLVDQGHEVHIAYQTSGNIAVFDDDAIRFADFVGDYNSAFNFGESKAEKLFQQVSTHLKSKAPGQVDSPEVQKIKGLIRRGEAKSACQYCGIKDENIHFMDLPFYETGRVRKKPLGEDDIKLTEALIKEIKPHQIYSAGDLSDPHGTHRVCLSAVTQAVKNCQGEVWMNDCYVWLYRGAWQEWELDKIEMAIPFSPEELLRKRRAIFKHQSQKDRPLFPGNDNREFWQRVDERNRGTAELYDNLGLAEYEAIEAFVKWDPKTKDSF
ncbi:MAG: glucosamine-6-phosphate deaminase [Balneolales bacterium]